MKTMKPFLFLILGLASLLSLPSCASLGARAMKGERVNVHFRCRSIEYIGGSQWKVYTGCFPCPG
jgi:hypothetical protein